jgi:formylglycine-generating enzyme required for sulfatase activity
MTRPPAPEQPIACVNWYEGKAYAAWLSGETGLTVRLPSEVVRGGSWFDYADGLASTVRSFVAPDQQRDTVGLRLAVEITKP